MAKYPDKLRKGRSKRSKAELNEHVSGSGKVKVKMLPRHAKAVAEKSGLNAYRCSVCGSHHVGRSPDQLAEDGWRKGRRR